MSKAFTKEDDDAPAEPMRRRAAAPTGEAYATEPGEIGLGAIVTVEDEDGERSIYRIVGPGEADPRRGWVSWQAPVGQALYGARVGDSIALPRGAVRVVAIS